MKKLITILLAAVMLLSVLPAVQADNEAAYLSADLASERFGRWYVKSGTGVYANLVNAAWDSCSTGEYDPSGNITLKLWDTETSSDSPLAYLYLRADTVFNRSVVKCTAGVFSGCNVNAAEVSVTVNAYGCEGLVVIDNITIADKDGTAAACVYLLPWGADWEYPAGIVNVTSAIPVSFLPSNYSWYRQNAFGGYPMPGSIGQSSAPAYHYDPRAAAIAQGVIVPTNFVFSYPNGRFVTFYSTDRDYGVWCKDRPENPLQYRKTSIAFPFNGWYYGTYNGWSLIRTMDDRYYYIYDSIVGMADINLAPEVATRGEGLIDQITAQGIVIPYDFQFIDSKVGEYYNNYGTETYAIYTYSDPAFSGHSELSFGKFYFKNPVNPNTMNYDGRATIYGYYNSLALIQSANGRWFWGSHQMFVPA